MITLFLGERFPVYAVFVFAKNEKADMSMKERKALQRVVHEIKQAAQARRR